MYCSCIRQNFKKYSYVATENNQLSLFAMYKIIKRSVCNTFVAVTVLSSFKKLDFTGFFIIFTKHFDNGYSFKPDRIDCIIKKAKY